MPTELVHSTGVRVVGPSGAVIPFLANTPQMIPDALVPFCEAAGCYPTEGFKKTTPKKSRKKAKETFKEIDPLLIVALMEILDSGDAAKLTPAGIPRKAVVTDVYGSVTEALIEAAMEQIAKTNDA